MYSVFVIPRKHVWQSRVETGLPHVLIIQLLHMYSRITLRQRGLVKSGKNDENYQSVIETLVKIVSLTGEKVRLSIAVSLYTMPVQRHSQNILAELRISL